MFKLVFLGTAASTPASERGLPSFALIREGGVFLFDCGEGTQRQMLKNNISYAKVAAVFLSHLHLDHILGVFGLAETIRLNLKGKMLDVYGPKGTASLFSNRPHVRVHELCGGETMDMGEFEVCCMQNNHMQRCSLCFVACEKPKVRFYEQKAKSLGLKGALFSQIKEKGSLKVNGKTIKLKDVTYVQQGKKVAYSGDTAYFPAFARLAKNADVIVHEATFSAKDAALAKEHKHSTSADAAKIAKKAGAKQLILTHLSSRYSSSLLEEEAKAIFPNSKAAFDGFSIEL